MKYFTYEWWKNMQIEGLQPHPLVEYRLHLARIRKLLTPELLRVEEGLCVHDGVVRWLNLDVQSAAMRLGIDLDDGDNPSCSVEFVYGGVRFLNSTAPGRDDNLAGPAGFGHLGYLETDVNENGFEHRMLFSSGIELRIQFAEFGLKIPGEAASADTAT